MITENVHCLVLGGRGFIGSHLVDALLAQGHRVRCFYRPSPDDAFAPELDHPRLEYFEGDLADEACVARALEGIDVCFHLISTTLPQSSNADPAYDVTTNVLSSVRLLTHAVEKGVKRVVFVSSGGTVYGIPSVSPIPETHPTDPVCSYGITKLAIEKYLGLFRHLHGLECTVLRIANPFGERQRMRSGQGAVAVFLGKVLRGEAIEVWGDGSVVRDYIYIADVVDSMLAAMRYSGPELVFNVGSGRGHSINEVLQAIEDVTGRQAETRYMPGRAFDVPSNVLCIERAKRELGWAPKTSFDEGLRRFSAWVSEDPGRYA